MADGYITITIASLPADNGSPITDLHYSINGGSLNSLGSTALADYEIGGLTPGATVAVRVYAENANGMSLVSDIKNVQVEGSAAVAGAVYWGTLNGTSIPAAYVHEAGGLTDGAYSEFTVTGGNTITPNVANLSVQSVNISGVDVEVDPNHVAIGSSSEAAAVGNGVQGKTVHLRDGAQLDLHQAGPWGNDYDFQNAVFIPQTDSRLDRSQAARSKAHIVGIWRNGWKRATFRNLRIIPGASQCITIGPGSKSLWFDKNYISASVVDPLNPGLTTSPNPLTGNYCVYFNGTGHDDIRVTDNLIEGGEYGFKCDLDTTSVGRFQIVGNTFTGSFGDQMQPGIPNTVAAIIAGNSFVNSARYGDEWVFDANTSAGDPGTGKFRLNNAIPGSATAAYISKTSNNGYDCASDVAASVYFAFRQKDDIANKQGSYGKGTVTDNGTYLTIALNNPKGLNAITDGAACLVTLDRGSHSDPVQIQGSVRGAAFGNMFDEGVGNSDRQGWWCTDGGHEVDCSCNGFFTSSIQPVRFGGNNGSKFNYNSYVPHVNERAKASTPAALGQLQIYNGDGSPSYVDFNYYGTDSTGSDVTISNSYSWASDSWAQITAAVPAADTDPLTIDWTSPGLFKRLLAAHTPAASGNADGRTPNAVISIPDGVEASEMVVDPAIYPAPTHSGASVTPGTTTASASVTTDTELWPLNWIVVPASETPSFEEVEACADHPAALDGGWAHCPLDGAASPKSISMANLASGTDYKLCLAQRAGWANKTLTTVNFTTS